jgi:dihydroorotate dehydrogenase electron transfer subunit
MDGSIGFEGHVVAAWLDAGIQGPTRVYACGPMIMLRAVAEAAAERGLACEISVETMMGCGVGACMSCVIENRAWRDGDEAVRQGMSPYDRWLLACREGPVFRSDRVVLDDGEFLH